MVDVGVLSTCIGTVLSGINLPARWRFTYDLINIKHSWASYLAAGMAVVSAAYGYDYASDVAAASAASSDDVD